MSVSGEKAIPNPEKQPNLIADWKRVCYATAGVFALGAVYITALLLFNFVRAEPAVWRQAPLAIALAAMYAAAAFGVSRGKMWGLYLGVGANVAVGGSSLPVFSSWALLFLSSTAVAFVARALPMTLAMSETQSPTS